MVGGSVTMMLSLGCEHDGIARRGLPPRRSRPPRGHRLRRAVGLRATRRGRQAGARDRRQDRHRRDGHRRVRATCRSWSSGSSSSAPTRARRCRPSGRASTASTRHTAPSDYYEGLIKAYVGDGLAADFYREIAAYLDAETREVIISSLEDSGQTAFIVERVRAGIAADHRLGGRLALWGRRLMGEALTQAQRVAGDRDSLTALLAGGVDRPGLDLAALGRMFTRLDRAARGPDGPARARLLSRPAAYARDEAPQPCGCGASSCRAGCQTRVRVPVLRPVTVEAMTTRTARGDDGDDPADPVDTVGAVATEQRVDVVAEEHAADAAEDGEPQRDVVLVAGGDELAEETDDRAYDDEDDDVHDHDG